MPTYILKSADSDCTGGSDFNKEVSTGTEGAGTVNTKVMAGNTEESFSQTPTGVPNSDAWETGSHTVEVNVTTANADMEFSMRVERVNSSCVVQEAAAATAEQNMGSTGVLNFTLPGKTWAAQACGDRLRYVYIFRSTAAMGQTSVDIETGTTDTEHVSPVAEDAGTCDAVTRRVFITTG